jgi:Glycosyl transferase family 2
MLAPKPDMRVTVVIPTWRRPSWLAKALLSVLAQRPSPVEIVVIGRPEDPEARAITLSLANASEMPIRWLEVDRPGHVTPVREGLKRSVGEIVAFLDDDTESESGWLAALCAPFADDRVACVGGRYIRSDEMEERLSRLSSRRAGRLKWYGRFLGHFGSLNGPVETDAVLEGTSAWRREVLARLEMPDLFDEGDGIHYGLDLTLQAKRLGYRVIYQPAARALDWKAPRAGDLPSRADAVNRARASGRNITYIALRRLPLGRRTVFLAGWVLVGQRQSPGLLIGLLDIIASRNQAGRILTGALEGRIEGVRRWARDRTADRRSPARSFS